MADCHAYSAKLKLPIPELISDLSDEQVMNVVTNHLKPEFWNMYRTKPDQYAYVRRWAMAVRREARSRGIDISERS